MDLSDDAEGSNNSGMYLFRVELLNFELLEILKSYIDSSHQFTYKRLTRRWDNFRFEYTNTSVQLEFGLHINQCLASRDLHSKSMDILRN